MSANVVCTLEAESQMSDGSSCQTGQFWLTTCKLSAHLVSNNTQAYIPKRRTLIQVLPPANAYTKYAHAYIHFAKSLYYS